MSVMSYGILNDYLASNDLRSLVYSCDSPGQQRTRSRSTNFTGNSVETFCFESFWNIYDGHRSGRAWNIPLLTINMKHVGIISLLLYELQDEKTVVFTYLYCWLCTEEVWKRIFSHSQTRY